jgi:hypothetical protein
MMQIEPERRVCDRRSPRGGGRRAADRANRPFKVPACPICQELGVAVLAGESDGGWWFVCLACDHLWDQRHPHGDRTEVDDEASQVAACLIHDARGASFWRRVLFRA